MGDALSSRAPGVRTPRTASTARLLCCALAVTMLGLAPAAAQTTGPSAGADSATQLLAQAAGSEVFRIAVPPTVTTSAATQVPLSIRVESSVATPRNSFLRVRGLPPTVS